LTLFVQEFIEFTCKLVVERSALPSRTSVKEQEYYCHCYVRADGLSGVVVSDAEYQQRVAFSMLTKVLDDFAVKVPASQWVCGYCWVYTIIGENRNMQIIDVSDSIHDTN